MKPQMQEFPHHDPQNGVVGDCFRAALASLLGLSLRQVPHFSKQHWGDKLARGEAINQFLAKRGLMLLMLPFESFSRSLQTEAKDTGVDCYHLMFGIEHSGEEHACVGLNGQMVHDPHPLRRGFANPPGEWKIGFMVNRLAGASKGGKA